MWSPRLNRVLAVIALVTAVAACSRSTEPVTPVAPRDVTFNRDIAPILYDKCASCHRPIAVATSTGAQGGPAAPALLRRPESDLERQPTQGGPTTAASETVRATTTGTDTVRPAAGATAAVASTSGSSEDPICVAGAPFSVLDYDSVRRHARAIASAVQRRAMPPWLPEAGHGNFVGERRLRDDQIALIAKWVESGAPEGHPADVPKLPTFPGGWQLGTPDLVLTLPEPYTLQPGSRDVFRNFVIPVPITSPRYVRAVEFRADRPQVLHHADLALDAGRVSRALDRAEPGPGFATMDGAQVMNVYGWTPGKVPALEPSDTAWTLEPGTDLVLLLHMIAGASSETVQPSIGLFFSDTPPKRTPISVKLEESAIDIPAGDASYVVEDSYVLPVDVDAVSVYPHAHYLGKEMRGTATLPDGSQQDLLWIRQWDFRWQDRYRYQTPVFLPKGTRVSMRFTFDNSTANPNNRSRPPQRVRSGPRSTDEMAQLWLEVVPRRAEDAAILNAEFTRRALLAQIKAVEQDVRLDPDVAAGHNLLASKYLQARRLPEAQAQLEQTLRLDPRDAEAHSNLGTLLQAQGRINEGMQHLRTAVSLKPKNDAVHFNLGNALLAAGQADAAIQEFQTAIALNPENADAHFNLAMVLGPRRQLDAAITHLRRAIEIDPRNGEAYHNLSVAYGLQGRNDLAIEAAQASVRLQPESAVAREQLQRLIAARARQ